MSLKFQEIAWEVSQERSRQGELGYTPNNHRHTQQDWVAFITAYVGRAAGGVHRNNRQGEEFRENMIKVAALAFVAIEAHDDGGRCQAP